VGSATLNQTSVDNDKNSALNNYAVVSGSGSRWEIGTLLSVGQNGTNNSLTIGTGGVVAVAGNVTISPQHPAYVDITNRENYISVEGGRLEVTNVAGTANLAVNRSWVAMKGSQGGVMANSLTLTNSGTLRFTADTEGFSPIDVSGTMLVGTQSFLTVDMAGYRGLGQIPLIHYGSMPAAFTNANISLTNGFGRIIQGTGNTIWLYAIRPGTMIMVM
jgi:T5SS/PEP-CTERM-associated repeat protein